jgi:tetratricopeptide (TPR) repeat protein
MRENSLPTNYTLLDLARECRATDPERALRLANQHIQSNPVDPHGYFSRHLTLSRLGRTTEALRDCTTAIGIAPKPMRYLARGEIYRTLGDHERALADFNRAHDMDREKWLTSFGPHLRADTLARLGRLDEAREDANLLPDDHWMPANSGLPGGSKREFIYEIERRAMAAKKSGRPPCGWSPGAR